MKDTAVSSAWAEIASASARAGQPGTLFDAHAAACGRIFGHRLLTILAWHPETNDTQRIYSTRPAQYPVGARKPMGVTAWGEHLLKGGQPWIGTTPDDIRWAFFDYNLIESLGCGACLSVPVRWDGGTLAAVSVLGPAGAYRPEQLAQLDLLSGLLVPGLLAARHA